MACLLIYFENNESTYGAGDLTLREYLLKIAAILITESIVDKLSKVKLRNIKTKL